MLANRTRRRAARAALVLAGPILVALGGTAAAAEPRQLGTFKDWNAFAFEEGGNKVCYVSSQPKKTEPANVRRGNIYALVTHRPAERALDVVSVLIGYPFKEGTEATVEVDRKPFSLFTDGETAWARDAETDKALAAAMRAGASMTVKGTSSRGTRTTDTYSLAGISQAYEAINEACGLKR
ncbi:invasion associated locus B family protein [Azospirillum sp. SYSU D00513]|uniref:invasion associated locus B family protein n=1 Tax=Azospirillum sp. SYSU D00513 TaxID=2812561 RepID=UPI001A9734C9|nr:invasion associated locus B family protein [Azospirillum sp. SYSU D00513]